MKRHLFINSNSHDFDSNCAQCGGKLRDSVHGATDEIRTGIYEGTREIVQMLQIVEQRAPLNPSAGCNTLNLLDTEIAEMRAIIGAGPRETARVTLPRLPGLSHGEIVDAFPVLEGMRAGFERDRLIDAEAFCDQAERSGSGARSLALVVISLTHKRLVNLGIVILKVDREHLRALATLTEAIAQRGMK